MLAQHLITQPVFEALFKDYRFVEKNPVSQGIQKILAGLDAEGLQAETHELDKFYESVRTGASGIDNAEGRQRVVIELYEKFFRNAFPKMAESLGIVYTPVEIVDFMLHSTDHLLRKELGVSLGSPHVNILDPFTGTGTFITRLIQSDVLSEEDLRRKYQKGIHANEITLLAYYIAAINIEEAYRDRVKAEEYNPFSGIVLADSFQMEEARDERESQIFPDNTRRIHEQQRLPINVVLGNPPYSAGQRSENDANKNLKYPKLDEKIRNTYAANTRATNRNSLYDSYIRAFRWASDRIGEEGIVAYVSNGGWLEGNAMDGFRKYLQDEFSSIYCLNLRGNTRTSGEQARKEGGQTFGPGSRTTITITFLIKKQGKTGDGRIHYHDIGDYLDRKEKLERIKKIYHSVENVPWVTITPNAAHDWLNQRSEDFGRYLQMAEQETGPSIFASHSRGLETTRDNWVYNFSRSALEQNMRSSIAFYNEELNRYRKHEHVKVDDFVNNDPTRISWSSGLKQDLAGGVAAEFTGNNIRIGAYRPFSNQYLYADDMFIHRPAMARRYFPHPSIRNPTICVHGIGANKEPSAFMVNMVPDLEIVSKSQCFPRYRYVRKSALQQAGGAGQKPGLGDRPQDLSRIDNIPQETVALFRKQYQNTRIDADDIFHYVYAVLHSREYRQRFAADPEKTPPAYTTRAFQTGILHLCRDWQKARKSAPEL